MKRTALRRLAALSIFLVAGSSALAAGGTVEPRKPDERDRCPVCGMFVAPYTEWIAQVAFADGSAVFFDGSRDLFEYLLARAATAPEIAATFVTTYYDLEVIPAESAFFVTGSDVYGPMGAELVPHATLEAAEEFLRDHRGSRIVRFAEVTAELLRTLGAPARGPPHR